MRRTNHRPAGIAAARRLVSVPRARRAGDRRHRARSARAVRRGHSGRRRQCAPRPALRREDPRHAHGARAPRCPIPSGKITQHRAGVRCAGDRRAALRLRRRTAHGRAAARPARIDMQVAAEMRTDTGVTTFEGSGLKMAGTTATFDGRLDEKGWQVKGSHRRRRRSPRCASSPRRGSQLPADITGDGKVAVEGSAERCRRRHCAGRHAEARWRRPHQRGQHHRHRQARRDGAAARATAATPTPRSQIEVAGTQGQVLVEPGAARFRQESAGARNARRRSPATLLTVDSLRLTQTDLIDLTGNGSVNLAGEIPRWSTATSSSRRSNSRRRTAATCRSRWPPPACSAISTPAVV